MSSHCFLCVSPAWDHMLSKICKVMSFTKFGKIWGIISSTTSYSPVLSFTNGILLILFPQILGQILYREFRVFIFWLFPFHYFLPHLVAVVITLGFAPGLSVRKDSGLSVGTKARLPRTVIAACPHAKAEKTQAYLSSSFSPSLISFSRT